MTVTPRHGSHRPESANHQLPTIVHSMIFAHFHLNSAIYDICRYPLPPTDQWPDMRGQVAAIERHRHQPIQIHASG